MIDIQEVPAEKIDWHSTNIRSVIDETGTLAESMEAHGQLEPGTGWWEENGRFRLATGHRRANACRHLGIPFLARIIEPMSGAELIEYQLVENIQAEALMPEDLENAVGALMENYSDHRKVGERIGKSATWVSTIIGAGKVRQSLEGDRSSDRNDNNSEAAGNTGKASATPPSMSTTAAAQFGRLKDEGNRKAAYEEAVRRNEGNENLSRGLVREVVEEFSEKEIRDVDAYVWKLQQERVKLVRKRADIEAEIDRIDAKILRLTGK